VYETVEIEEGEVGDEKEKGIAYGCDDKREAGDRVGASDMRMYIDPGQDDEVNDTQMTNSIRMAAGLKRKERQIRGIETTGETPTRSWRCTGKRPLARSKSTTADGVPNCVRNPVLSNKVQKNPRVSTVGRSKPAQPRAVRPKEKGNAYNKLPTFKSFQ
jgi:hypothetical protein